MVYYCQLLSARWEIVSETVFKRWNEAIDKLDGVRRYSGNRMILDEDADTVQLIGSFTKQDLIVIGKIRGIIPTNDPMATEAEQVILQNSKGKKEVHFKGGYKATLKAA